MSLAPLRTLADTPRIADFIDAAARLIAQQGYDRTSVRDIARAINLSSGTMFYHFKTKDDLLEAVISKGINDGVAHLAEAYRGAEGGALHRFLALVTAHLGLIHGELHHVHRVWIREWDRLSPEARLRLRPQAEQYRALLGNMLLALTADGYLKTDPATARHLLLPALNWTTAWADLPDEASRASLGEQICAAILNQPVAAFRSLVRAEAGGS